MYIKVRLSSTGVKENGEKTGFFYTTTKNSKNKEKLRLKKYDPVTNKHEWFEEEKLK